MGNSKKYSIKLNLDSQKLNNKIKNKYKLFVRLDTTKVRRQFKNNHSSIKNK